MIVCLSSLLTQIGGFRFPYILQPGDKLAQSYSLTDERAPLSV